MADRIAVLQGFSSACVLRLVDESDVACKEATFRGSAYLYSEGDIKCDSPVETFEIV